MTMAKHSQAFIEVVTRFYIPLGHDLKDLEGINLADLVKQSEAVNVHKPNTHRKGGRNAKAKR
jgi:hypothetical protein